ncbi:hypothetical protein CM49_05621 [Paenibacillus sp. P1XP2]|nr:hypothetical protein CM49_05621 [Paenibacillus sp. P1XP2]
MLIEPKPSAGIVSFRSFPPDSFINVESIEEKAFGYKWKYSSFTVFLPGWIQVSVSVPLMMRFSASSVVSIWYSTTRSLRISAVGFCTLSCWAIGVDTLGGLA